MVIVDGQVQVSSFITVTLGILALFLGKFLNSRIRALRDYTIPEPVSGGQLIAVAITVLHLLSGLEISFGLRARDVCSCTSSPPSGSMRVSGTCGAAVARCCSWW
jgi:ESS family glutamate:Na+ symporter